MTKTEMMDNLGTIARSGSKNFVDEIAKIKDDAKPANPEVCFKAAHNLNIEMRLKNMEAIKKAYVIRIRSEFCCANLTRLFDH